MADQEIITVSELDVADGASLSAEDQFLVHKATEGKVQRVNFSGLMSQERESRVSNDAALQLQINTMAGIQTDGETPTYRVVEKLDASLKGANNGVAELDAEGHVPSSQLPSYVDDVIEGYYKKADGKFYEEYSPASVTHDIWTDGTVFINSDMSAGTRPAGEPGIEEVLGTVRKYGTDYYQLDTDWYMVTALTSSAITLDSTAEDDPAVIAALNSSDDLTISYIPYVEDTGTYSGEITPETGKIYVDLRTNLTYRWGRTVYAPLSSDLALGETSATAYRGDRGKAAYDHSQVRGTGMVSSDNPHGLSASDIGLGNVPNVTTNNQTPTYDVAAENAELSSGETLSAAFGKLAKIVRSFISHIANMSNPHAVTKAQVGLGDVTNVATTSTISSGDNQNITSGAVYSALNDFDQVKQPKTMSSSVVIDGTTETTVEGAIGTLAGKVVDTVKTVQTLPVSPDIQTRIYKCNGRYYIGDGTNQTLTELSLTTDIPEVIEYVQTLPVSPNINDVIYYPSSSSYIYAHSKDSVKDFLEKHCTNTGYYSQYPIGSRTGYSSNKMYLYTINDGFKVYVKGIHSASLNEFYEVKSILAGYTIYDDYHGDNLPYAWTQFSASEFTGNSREQLESWVLNTASSVAYQNTPRVRCSADFESAYSTFATAVVPAYESVLAPKNRFYAGDSAHQLIIPLTSSSIFIGTQAEWNALSSAEQQEYTQANLTDVNSVVHVPVDTIANGNMNPPTSNAVYDAIIAKALASSDFADFKTRLQS